MMSRAVGFHSTHSPSRLIEFWAISETILMPLVWTDLSRGMAQRSFQCLQSGRARSCLRGLREVGRSKVMKSESAQSRARHLGSADLAYLPMLLNV